MNIRLALVTITLCLFSAILIAEEEHSALKERNKLSKEQVQDMQYWVARSQLLINRIEELLKQKEGLENLETEETQSFILALDERINREREFRKSTEVQCQKEADVDCSTLQIHDKRIKHFEQMKSILEASKDNKALGSNTSDIETY